MFIQIHTTYLNCQCGCLIKHRQVVYLYIIKMRPTCIETLCAKHQHLLPLSPDVMIREIEKSNAEYYGE